MESESFHANEHEEANSCFLQFLQRIEKLDVGGIANLTNPAQDEIQEGIFRENFC
jgi:hypothetical protein